MAAKKKRKSTKSRAPKLIDIGSGFRISYYRWAPDDLPENRKRYGVPLPRVEKAGLILRHPRADGKPTECIGSVQFDLPETRQALTGAKWKVDSWEPLTLSPSIRCLECGAHGYIRSGRWVQA
jgi:hypothetical protein